MRAIDIAEEKKGKPALTIEIYAVFNHEFLSCGFLTIFGPFLVNLYREDLFYTDK